MKSRICYETHTKCNGNFCEHELLKTLKRSLKDECLKMRDLSGHDEGCAEIYACLNNIEIYETAIQSLKSSR